MKNKNSRKFITSVKNKLRLITSTSECKDILLDLKELSEDKNLYDVYNNESIFVGSIKDETALRKQIGYILIAVIAMCALIIGCYNLDLSANHKGIIYFAIIIFLYLYLSRDYCMIKLIKSNASEHINAVIIQSFIVVITTCLIFISNSIIPNLITNNSIDNQEIGKYIWELLWVSEEQLWEQVKDNFFRLYK